MTALEFIAEMVSVIAWPFLVFAIALMFKNQIRDLSQAVRRIRVGQLEAEVERVKDEAAATIDQLRDVALSLSAPAATSLLGIVKIQNKHTISAPSVVDRLEQANDVVSALVELGVERDEAEKVVLEPLLDFIRQVHISWIRESVKEIMEPETNPFLRRGEFPILDQLAAEEISVAKARSHLRDTLSAFPDELQDRVEDLEHFDATRALRRPMKEPWSD